MGSRPPLRRTPSRSPPPAPPASSSTSPPPASTGGKIIRLPQRPGDSAPTPPSRADVTLPRPLRPSLPSRNLKRPASHPPLDPNLPPPAAAPPPHRPPVSWKRRLTPAAEPKKAPPPEEDRPRDAKPAAEAAKPQAAPDESKPGPDAPAPATDRDEQKERAAVEAPDPPEDPETLRSEVDDLAAAAFEAVMVEGARYERAQTEWICEALRGFRDDITKVAESGDRAALSKLLKMASEGLVEPAEGHLKAIGEALAEMDAMVEQIRKRWEEEGTVVDDDANLEGDEDAMDEDGAAR